jgi:hypothetical protein
MDRGRCEKIIVGYRVGPCMLRLISYFWDEAVLVCRAQGRYGKPFKAGRRVTQGGPVSPFREWLSQVLGVEAARSGYGEALRVLIAIFYADYGMIASWDKAFLQKAFDILINLFEHVGLRTNTTKTKGMTCVSTRIWTKWSHEVYNNVRHSFHTLDQWQNRQVQV